MSDFLPQWLILGSVPTRTFNKQMGVIPMLDSVSSVATSATQMSSQNKAQQVDLAVLKKVQDLQTQQGLNALQLIESAVVSADKIDVYV